jgi:hypothetical protein
VLLHFKQFDIERKGGGGGGLAAFIFNMTNFDGLRTKTQRNSKASSSTALI